MHVFWSTIFFVIAGSLTAAAQSTFTYRGFCDASAAVMIGGQHFLVAGDEYNEPDPHDPGETINRGSYLYLFKQGDSAALGFYPLPPQLRDNAERELDIEGATRIGKRVFWITSHGRNKKGKLRPNRYRLFAIEFAGSLDDLKMKFVGGTRQLVRDLLDAENWQKTDGPTLHTFLQALYEATRLDEDLPKPARRRLAPKRHGLNIEALAATPDGKKLLIGLRNPLINGRAAVVGLLNGDDLVTGKSDRARFAGPYFLDLNGKGLRGMAYSARLGAYLIIAGPVAGSGRFDLVAWKGPGSSTVRHLKRLTAERGSNPESVIVPENASTVLIVNDEGSKKKGSGDCKHAPEADQSFTVLRYTISR